MDERFNDPRSDPMDFFNLFERLEIGEQFLGGKFIKNKIEEKEDEETQINGEINDKRDGKLP